MITYYDRYDIFIFCLLLLFLGISGLLNNARDTSRHLRSQTLFLSIQSVIIYIYIYIVSIYLL